MGQTITSRDFSRGASAAKSVVIQFRMTDDIDLPFPDHTRVPMVNPWNR